LGLFKDEAKQRELEEQIKMLALADADEVIAQEVLSLIKNRI
jgi:hypothetical protein